MARFRLKNLNNVSNATQSRINRALKSSSLLKEIADGLIEDIQSGESPKTGKPFPRLADSTIENRRRLARTNQTDKNYSPKKSNLTLTGQLVRSIKAKINLTRGELIIEPTGSRRPYRGVNKRLKQSVRTNKELATIHANGGRNLPKRDIIRFSKKRVREIVRLIRARLKDEFR